MRSFGKLNQQFNLKENLNFIKPKENSTFNIHDTNCIKILNRLTLHFIHLNEYKFRHNFSAAIDPICSCGLEPETTHSYRCSLCSDLRIEALNYICALNPTLKNLSREKLSQIFLYGSGHFSFNTKTKIINSTINF